MLALYICTHILCTFRIVTNACSTTVAGVPTLWVLLRKWLANLLFKNKENNSSVPRSCTLVQNLCNAWHDGSQLPSHGAYSFLLYSLSSMTRSMASHSWRCRPCLRCSSNFCTAHATRRRLPVVEGRARAFVGLFHAAFVIHKTAGAFYVTRCSLLRLLTVKERSCFIFFSSVS